MPSVALKDISKRYKIYPSAQDRLKEILTFGRVDYGHEFWALKNIDFSVEPGSILGILGRNGAGKSTLLKIISGVLQPTGGEVEVNGRLSALLQLGAGFNGEFTGRENVLLNGLILGIDRQEMAERFDEIAAFADLGEFMNQPVKTYSSGMRARLGFAVSVNVEPDVLIVDETLSVGDAVFRQMGLQKMRELMNSGTTILFVSHGLGMIRSFCTEALLLHQGEMIASGEVGETLDRYQALVSNAEAEKRGQGQKKKESAASDSDDSDTPSFKNDPKLENRSALRYGTGEAKISNVEILNESRQVVDTVVSGSTVSIRVYLEYAENVGNTSLRVTLRNPTGLEVFSTNTWAEGVQMGKRTEGEQIIVDFTFEVPLQQGNYSVSAALSHSRNKDHYLDRVDVATMFKIALPEGRKPIDGLVDVPTQVEVHNPIQNTVREQEGSSV